MSSMSFFVSQFINLLFATLFMIMSAIGVNPMKRTEPATPTAPSVDLDAPYVFESEPEYEEYYDYISEQQLKNVRENGGDIAAWTKKAEQIRERLDDVILVDGIQYALYQNKTASVIDSQVSLTTAKIPESVNGYKVVGVTAFYAPERGVNSSNVTELTIPDTVEYIGEDAFAYSTSLRVANIGRRVKYVGSGAFNYCYKLTVVNLPDALEAVSNGMFSQCYALTEVRFGKGVKQINDGAFGSCMFLDHVVLPGSVTEIGAAFQDCRNLKEIYIPASVTEIDRSAFYQTRKVTIRGEAGSYAETYAKENGFKFVVE